VGDYFEGVALVDEEGLAFGGVVHFVGVFGDEGVEEGVEAFVVSAFGAEDATESLSLLATRTMIELAIDSVTQRC
jgi:hypothetical protein